MPRGYLKHNKGISKKEARGGSSGGRGFVAEKDQGPARIRGAVEDFALCIGASKKCANTRKAVAYQIEECSICFKEGPVVCLSNKCKWHDAACKQCLHSIYITNAQKSTKSYPLTCFHPLCQHPVQASQLDKHNIFASTNEMRKHHEMLVRSKIEKEGMLTVHCPYCAAPRGIRKLGDNEKVFGCSNPSCNSSYQVSPFYATLRSLDNMKSDEFGINDGWAKCPHCGILISKGDGCDHMCCLYCDNEFCWDEAVQEKEKIRHAIVPDSEIYRWW